MKNLNINDLECFVNRQNYDEKKIEALAELIEKTGGLLRPLIVQRLAPKDGHLFLYEVVDGFLAYFAALDANENNITLTHVPCWVISDFEDLQAVMEQLELIAESEHLIDDDYYQPTKPDVIDYA